MTIIVIALNGERCEPNRFAGQAKKPTPVEYLLDNYSKQSSSFVSRTKMSTRSERSGVNRMRFAKVADFFRIFGAARK